MNTLYPKVDLTLNITGAAGSGKTFILQKIIPVLENEGYTISPIKYDYKTNTETIKLSFQFTRDTLFK